MSIPTDGVSLSAGVALPFFGDDESAESDDDDGERDDSSSSGGILDRLGLRRSPRDIADTAVDSATLPAQLVTEYGPDAIEAGDRAIQTTVDATFDNPAFSVQDTTRNLLAGAGGYDSDEAFASAYSESFTDFTDEYVGPSSTSIDSDAGGLEGAFYGAGEFTEDVVFEYPRAASAALTGTDPEEGGTEDDVPAAAVFDVALAGAPRAASIGTRAFTEIDMASRLGRLLGRGADDVAGIFRGADEAADTTSSTGRQIDDALDNVGGSTRLADNPDNLPVVRGGIDDLSNLPVAASDEVADATSTFDDTLASLSGVTSSARSGVDNLFSGISSTVRNNPLPTAVAGGTAAGVGGAAYAFDRADGDDPLFGTVGGGDSDETPGDTLGSTYDSYDIGANNYTNYGGGPPIEASWSVDSMAANATQTVEVRVSNNLDRPVDVALVLTARLGQGEYIVDETRSRSIGSDSGSTQAYQLTIPTPANNGLSGTQRVSLYGRGTFGADDGTTSGGEALEPLGTRRFSIQSASEDQANENPTGTASDTSGSGETWGEAVHVATLQYGWHIFQQTSSEDAVRYMVAGQMEDGSTRYLDGRGRVGDSPTFFESQDEAVAAHRAWVERAANGETGTDASTRPGGTGGVGGGRPAEQRVTEDANRAGGSGVLGTLARATGLSGDGLTIGRVARFSITMMIALWSLDQLGVINLNEWPVIDDVLARIGGGR